MTKIRRLLSMLFLTALCCIQLIANAQNVTEIRGEVNDENGQPVANASVYAKNQSTGQTAATQTDSLGIFTYHNLPVGGPYSFVVSHVGFQSQTLSGNKIKTRAEIGFFIKIKAGEKGLKEMIFS